MNKRILKIVFLLLIIYVTPLFSDDDEYFGKFSGDPSFKIKNNVEGRPTFILLEDFHFIDPNGFKWETPKNTEVDGASIPQFAWSFIGGPMSGKYLHASIIHDRYCEIKSRTAHDTHRNFYYGMRANGVPETKARVMYWAVRTFGPSWKIIKEPVILKLRGVNKYRYRMVETRSPSVSEAKLAELIKQAESNVSLSKLDALSDSIRSEYGSEKLQKEVPEIPIEILYDPPSFLKKNNLFN